MRSMHLLHQKKMIPLSRMHFDPAVEHIALPNAGTRVNRRERIEPASDLALMSLSVDLLLQDRARSAASLADCSPAPCSAAY
ncbi:hypothetical protein [Cohnella yongneupensis]|uniref:Uncharacterized protein n=1 Tax=Cohnella yongneupensis TaxID=425006 RepID=A0ABW0QSP8_9BACL